MPRNPSPACDRAIARLATEMGPGSFRAADLVEMALPYMLWLQEDGVRQMPRKLGGYLSYYGPKYGIQRKRSQGYCTYHVAALEEKAIEDVSWLLTDKAQRVGEILDKARKAAMRLPESDHGARIMLGRRLRAVDGVKVRKLGGASLYWKPS